MTSTSTSRSRSGSETRCRDKRLLVRLDQQELAEVMAGAEAARLTLASFARAKILSGPVRKSSRRPPPDAAQLAHVLGRLGYVGSNLNQIARAVNGGDMEWLRDLPLAIAEFRETNAAIMRALGFRPDADNN